MMTATLLLLLGLLPSHQARVCNVLVGIDEPLFKEHNRSFASVTELANDHFDRVNEIFNSSVFTGDQLGDLSFHVARVQVVFGSCDYFTETNCTDDREKFLEEFGRRYNQLLDFSSFCLVYLFTYRDFHNSTAGLANKGGVCNPPSNSGFITLLNNGESRSVEDSTVTLAHELGHSLGAHHDQEECGGGFIMADQLDSPLPSEFSNCSIPVMQTRLREVVEQGDCLLEDRLLTTSLCGNGEVEAGEQCDCGDTQESCTSSCCYPAHISDYERSINSSALPCSTADRSSCLTPPELFYGIYLPLAFILTVTILVAVFLRHDWTRDRSLFKHITKGNIRIVTKRSKTATEQNRGEEGVLAPAS